MYRYSVSNEIVYTPEDLILFRESPFASWMERLTLENPAHGIAPDPAQTATRDTRSGQDWRSSRSDAQWSGRPLDWEEFVSGVSIEREPVRKPPRDIVALLKQDAKDVVSIGRHLAEEERRSLTNRAMRAGAEYIADGQLALGQMACRVDLLIRCDGVSEYGGYLYVPCATDRRASRHIAHHLCFAADLLKSLQGVQPAELLVFRPGENITCLPARDHMQRFSELKYEFMTAQLSFRKHRMPDPAQSSHFGRWSRCARDILARRVSAREHSVESAPAHLELPAAADGQGEERSGRLSGEAGEGLARAMKQAIASVAAASAAPDDLIDRDAPADTSRHRQEALTDRASRYGRG